MITLGSVNFVPQPSINIMPEFFYYGKEVVGGYLVLELKGTHHSEDYTDFNNMQDTLLGMQDTCQLLHVSNPAICTNNILTETTTLKLSGVNARVTEVRVSVGSSELDLNYTITLECSKDNSKIPFIKNTTGLPFETHIGNKAIVQSYSEKVTATYNNVNKFILDIQNNKVHLIKSHATFNIDLKLSLFYNDMCDSNNIEYAKEIDDFLYARMQDIIDNPDKVGINPYPKNTYQLLGTNVKYGWDGPYVGSLTFQLYLLPVASSAPKALVDFSETEETNQITGAVSLKVKGSIVGLDSSKSARSPNHDSYANAQSAYNTISDYYSNPAKGYILITDCSPGTTTTTTTTPAPPPPDTPDNPPGVPQERIPQSGMCYELVNSSVSHFSSASRIDFDMTYQDTELCSLLGYKLSTQYEERPSVNGRAEHISPGRPYNYGPLTYYSNASSAPKYKITVQGELPSSCLQHSVGRDDFTALSGNGGFFADSLNLSNKVTELKKAVDDEFNLQKIKWKLTTANNIMPGKGQTTTSRYKYSVTQEFIKCQ